MIRTFRELISYRELLFVISYRDIKIKYKQSIMGFMWAIFMPMIIVSAGILVKYGMAQLSGTSLHMSQVVTVSIKALPWAFFVSSLRFATNSLTANTNLVTKIYFPKVVFPVAAVISQLFDFLIASIIFVIILFIIHLDVSVHLLWVPMLLITLVVLVTGMGILLSAANLFFRDVKYIVEVIVTFAIFFTPVFYEVEILGRWGWILLLNPVAPILEALNACVVHRQMFNVPWLLYSMGISVGGFFLAVRFFQNVEPKFAEKI